jgi:hypothetical protein
MATAVAMTSDIVETLGYMAPPVWSTCAWIWSGLTGVAAWAHHLPRRHGHRTPAPGGGKGRHRCRLRRGATASSGIRRLATTYYDYRDNGGLEADLAKLRKLVEGAA